MSMRDALRQGTLVILEIIKKEFYQIRQDSGCSVSPLRRRSCR